MNEAVIRRVREPFGELGNMAPFPVQYEGLVYPTSEALFQALRFGVGSEEAEQIRTQKTPMAAKMAAKKLLATARIKPRSDDDLYNMRFVLRLKYRQHAAVRGVLASTENARIIEDCTARANESGLFWGAKKTTDGWVGENVLGEMWMKVRKAHVKRLLLSDPSQTLVLDAVDGVKELSRRNGWVVVLGDEEFLRQTRPGLLIEEDIQHELL